MRMGSKLVSAALSLVFLPLGIQARRWIPRVSMHWNTVCRNAIALGMRRLSRKNSWTIPFCVQEWVLWVCSAIPCQVILRDRPSRFVGKMFDPLNAVSVGGTVSEFRRNVDGVRVWRVGAGISHSFDFTSYFYGYSPSRIFNVSTIEGRKSRLYALPGSILLLFR